MGELGRERPLSVAWLRGAGGGGIKQAAAGDIPLWSLVGLWGYHWAEAGRYRLEFLS